MVAISLLLSRNVPAQGKHVNCDSLLDVVGNKMGFIDKPPSPIKPLNEIENDFESKIIKGNLEETIYVVMIIDTLGNARCLKILKGTNTAKDTAAIKYLSSLKFTPAEYRGKKKRMAIVIQFLKSSVTDSPKMKKVDGRWVMKDGCNQ